MLTVAIPTYDRNARLLVTLGRLLPQMTPGCRLIILDNCSPSPVEPAARALLARFPEVDARIVRHPYNLGAPANFLRGFELCETEHLWLLGDDDPPREGAVRAILDHIERYPEAVYFNFSGADHPCKRSRSVTTEGLDGLMDHIVDFGQMIWISVCVFRCAPLQKYLRFSCSYLQGICPQFLPVLLAAKEDAAQCHLSTLEIVDFEPPPATGSYNIVVIALAAMSILDLSWPDATRRRLAAAIRQPFSLTPLKMTARLHALALSGNSREDCLYWFDQIASRVFYFDGGIVAPLWHRVLRQIVKYPHAAKSVMGLVRLLRGREAPPVQPSDVFNRA